MSELLANFINVHHLENTILLALIGGGFVFLLTSLGSILAFFGRNLPEWFLDVSIAFSAGVMIVASFTSLILPSIEISRSPVPALIGIPLGLLMILAIERLLPHEHLTKGYEGPEHLRKKLKMIWLLVLTMIIHNLPEGLAVGVSIATDVKTGIITTIAIGIQDFPEGLVVTLPLVMLRRGRWQALALGVFSGFTELITSILGALFFGISRNILPFGLSIAGGAMLYVTLKEMIPEIYKKEENEILITIGFFLGFLVMLFLDSLL